MIKEFNLAIFIIEVHMIPLEDYPEGNYQSYWGCLTFEF